MANGLMAGKKGLIMGVANNSSIAWGIAKALADQGAEIALSYQGEALKKRVEPLAAEIGVTTLVECDVQTAPRHGRDLPRAEGQVGDDGFPPSTPSAFPTRMSSRPLHQHQRRQFGADHEYLGLFVHRRRQARRSHAEPRWFAADADLLRR